MNERGRRRATMAEVAEAAGVSTMTVSYTYSQPERVSAETREKVRVSAGRLGYVGPDPAARSLRRGRTGSIGVVLGEDLSYAFDDPQASRFLAGVAAVCAPRRLGMTLIPVTGDADDVDRVREAAVDGFIVWSALDVDPVLDAIVGTGRPVAVQGGEDRPGAAAVSIDDRTAARAVAAAVLVGARRLGVVSFPFGRDRHARIEVGPDAAAATFPVTRLRLEGLRDHCDQSATAWADVRVAVVSRNDRADAGEIIGELLDGPRGPDAIAAMSDELALATLDALAARHLRVPTDVAVSGWDDTSAAAAAGLTTVRQSLKDQGMRCARLALGERQGGRSRPAWQLVRRTSTRRNTKR